VVETLDGLGNRESSAGLFINNLSSVPFYVTMSQTTSRNLRRKEPFYFDCVVFQVENALFKLPKNRFTRSSIFATIFTLPHGENDVEGTDDKPFVLHGITEFDFQSLLKVMFPISITEYDLTQQEWISVLKLSTMWEFIDIREVAMKQLSTDRMEMTTFVKIECGRTYEVKKWLLDGYVELVKRGKAITDEEAQLLGWSTTARLLRLREQFLRLAVNSTCRTCGDDVSGFNLQDLPKPKVAAAVQKEFQKDL